MSERTIREDRRIRRTRREIRAALVMLMREKGFESVTVREIAERAGINRTTFYFHFRDKYDLLDQCIDEVLEEFAQALRAVEGGGGRPCFPPDDRQVAAHFEHVAENAELYAVLLGRNGVPAFGKRMRKIIQDLFYEKYEALLEVAGARNTALASKEAVCAYAASAHFGLIEWWLDQGMPHTPLYMARLLKQLLLRGPVGAVFTPAARS